MMYKKTGLFTLAVVLGAGIVLWYRQLSFFQKLRIKEIVRQIPDLPGRYLI
jgi:hypothetical protein